MRKAIALLLCAGLVNFSYARKKNPEFEKALVRGAQMKMVLRVHDDEGIPVKSAEVHTAVENLHAIYNLRGETDTNGICVVEGVATGNRIEIFIEKDGYYKSHRKYCFITMGAEREVKDGKWQPYGAEERLELRRIRKPKDLINYWTLTSIPETNAWIGVDMKRKSFIAPYGTGEYSDFEIKVDWDGLPPASSRYCAGYIRFSQPLSGAYYAPKVQESRHPYPYNADTDALYRNEGIKIVNRDGGGHIGAIPFNPNAVLVMRTRCQVEGGQILKANYGFIELFEVSPEWDGKPSVRLSYVFNPTPNDTNLEAKP